MKQGINDILSDKEYMKHYLKIATIYLLRILLRVFYVFPVKRNRILFSTHEGMAFNCNPKYIFEYIYLHYGKSYEYVWCLNEIQKMPSVYSDVICVKYLSIKHIYYLLTSKVIVNNLGIEPIIPKRKSQLFIHTTHGGGAYKKGGLTAKYISKSEAFSMRVMKNLRAKMTDYVISSCRVYTNIFSSNTEYNIPQSKFLPIGMPRNDLFFHNYNSQNIRSKIADIYNFDSKKIIVLYAPTYRGHNRKPCHRNLQLSVSAICEAVQQRFNNEVVMLYRHHIVEKDLILEGSINVSEYQDMQELLLITDVFITDYSSSIWDYSFSYKPGFLFTPDLLEYKSETDFHTPIESWPYPYSLTIEELCNNIINYDETEAIQKIKDHHSLLGSYENGNATSVICDLIRDNLN